MTITPLTEYPPDVARPTRVIYVEDDPALRGIVTGMLGRSDELEIVAACASSTEALAQPIDRCDVALLDLALGPESMPGTELGLAMRQRNPNIGIVIFSQHVVPDFTANLPENLRWGWSFIEKRGDIDASFLVEVLRATAKGLNVVDPNMARARAEAGPSPIEQLSARQREILSLAATGLDATGIADQLSLAPITVRQDLSKSYAILVPNPKPGTDLRTTAVLRYLRETRGAIDQGM